MKGLISLFLLLSACFVLEAQKTVDIKFSSTAPRDGASCFDIMLRSASGDDIDLAGQNYRMFFNGDKASFRSDLISYELDKRTYGKLDVQYNTDQNIGFVSLSLDSRKLTEEVITLSRHGGWAQTMNICFDHEENETIDLTWANAKKTSRFATAEVAFSEWVDKDNQQVVNPNEVHDYSSADFKESVEQLDLTLYPNPTSELLQVELNGNTDMRRLIIKDIIGREYISQDFDGVEVASYDVTSWPEGSYTVMLADLDGKFLVSEQIVKINP